MNNTPLATTLKFPGIFYAKPGARFVTFLRLIGLTALTLTAASCSLARNTAPAIPLSQATPTPTIEAPRIPNDSLIIKLADGSAVNLTVTNCEGMGRGGWFDLDAKNDRSSTDQERVDVQINGGNQGEGTYENFNVVVLVGNHDTPVFSGNTSAANVTLTADGSGSFKNVKIVNDSSAPSNEKGKAYPFSAEWSCIP